METYYFEPPPVIFLVFVDEIIYAVYVSVRLLNKSLKDSAGCIKK